MQQLPAKTRERNVGRKVWLIAEIAALGVVALAAVPKLERRASFGALLSFAFGALMTVFVFGADTYTNDGRTRWENRGGGAHAFFVIVMVVAAVCTAVLALLAARGTRGWIVRQGLVLGGAGQAFIGFLLFLAFGSN